MINKLYNRSGIYYIQNKLNNKIYVGSSVVSVKGRVQKHIAQLKENNHPNCHLQAAWNLYGEESFELGTICFCPPEKCIEKEQHYIDQYKCADPKFGYNICEKADSRLGVKVSPESRRRIAVAQVGKRLSEEHKEKVGIGNTGKKMTIEQRSKLSTSMLGNTNGSGKRGGSYCGIGRVKDLTYKEYGRLKVIRLHDIKPHARWLCLCKCGKEVIVYGNNLKKPNGTRSCGCLLTEMLVERNNKGTGKKHSKEHRAKIGKALIGNSNAITKQPRGRGQ